MIITTPLVRFVTFNLHKNGKIDEEQYKKLLAKEKKISCLTGIPLIIALIAYFGF